MSSKKRYKIICKKCRVFLCESDGEFLYVENLEILPKVGRKKNGWRPLPCPECETVTRIYLKPPEEKKLENRTRKFSIFRSRFG